ncbi:MAG: hypothetical protein JSR77_14135 [Planctomycetes bacterium]|nr:hypothetical protein [Planctomycetota bacterium]
MNHLVFVCAALASCAAAQELLPIAPDTPIRRLVWHEGDPRATLVDSTYAPRSPTTYDANTPAACAAFFRISNVLEDVDFGPVGPWAITRNNALRTISIPVANSGTTALSYDVRVSIWDDADFEASPMIASNATPLFRSTVPVRSLPNGAYDLVVTPTTPPALPDTRVFVQLEFFAQGTTNQLSISTGQPSRTYVVNITHTGPGSTTESWGLDSNNDRTLAGGPRGTTEHQRTSFSSGACLNQALCLPLIITGDVFCTADFNHDGRVDNADNAAFLARWENGDIAADINGDGGVDGADSDVFFTHRAAGC